VGWWPWRRRGGARRGRLHLQRARGHGGPMMDCRYLQRARGHGGPMMDCRLGKGGRKKMTWDPHASEWRGER
jgi:hypothetical protein